MSSLARRMLGAALLDADTYEEVEADRRSLRQAAGIVAASCAAVALARFVQGYGGGAPGGQVAFRVALAVATPLVVWIGGSAFSFMVGATFLRGPETQTDFAEVLRTTGFAFTPGLLRAGACLPPDTLGITVDLAATAWVLVAGVVAIRQALDFTTGRALGTFGAAAALLWLLLWGLTVAPLPF